MPIELIKAERDENAPPHPDLGLAHMMSQVFDHGFNPDRLEHSMIKTIKERLEDGWITNSFGKPGSPNVLPFVRNYAVANLMLACVKMHARQQRARNLLR